jgi:hypothetical protein
VAPRREHTAERVAATGAIAPAQYPNPTKDGDENMTARGQLQAPSAQVDVPRCPNKCRQAMTNGTSSAEAATEDPRVAGEHPERRERSWELARNTTRELIRLSESSLAQRA